MSQRELCHQLSHSQDEKEFLQGFSITLSFLFPGSSSSVLPAARDYPYPGQQEAKHSLFYRGVGACGTNRTQTAFGKPCHPGKNMTGVSSDCSCAGEFWPSVLLQFVTQRQAGEDGAKPPCAGRTRAKRRWSCAESPLEGAIDTWTNAPQNVVIILVRNVTEGIPHFMDLIYHKETSRFLLDHLIGHPFLGEGTLKDISQLCL